MPLELHPAGLVDTAALNHLKTKKLLPGFSYLDVWLHEHAVAFTVAKMMDQDMLGEVREAITDALQNGTAFNDFKKRLKPYLMAKGWWGEQVMLDPVDGIEKVVQLGSTKRLNTIFQTNMETAFAAGKWQRIQTNKNALPYLRYNPSAASHPRESHRRYYDLILPVEHPIWKVIYPPNGYGCQCSVSQLTRRQAKKLGISEEPAIHYTEVTNPRTGEIVKVPADITPSFAHNHGDRLGALDALFGEKHDKNALDTMIHEREEWLSKRYRAPTLKTMTLPITVTQKAIRSLLIDPLDGKEKYSEALAAAQWEVANKVKLQRYDLPNNNPPDFMVVTENSGSANWETLDFMFTEDERNAFKIDKFNQYFANTPDAWEKKQDNIQKHLAKADIVPLDLRHLNAINRAKIMAYVLSLPKEQQDRIKLLVSESK